jgi:hypothetical protein
MRVVFFFENNLFSFFLFFFFISEDHFRRAAFSFGIESNGSEGLCTADLGAYGGCLLPSALAGRAQQRQKCQEFTAAARILGLATQTWS